MVSMAAWICRADACLVFVSVAIVEYHLNHRCVLLIRSSGAEIPFRGPTRHCIANDLSLRGGENVPPSHISCCLFASRRRHPHAGSLIAQRRAFKRARTFGRGTSSERLHTSQLKPHDSCRGGAGRSGKRNAAAAAVHPGRRAANPDHSRADLLPAASNQGLDNLVTVVMADGCGWQRR